MICGKDGEDKGLRVPIMNSSNRSGGGHKWDEERRPVWITEAILLCIAVLVLLSVIVTSWYTFYSHDDFTTVQSARGYGTNLIVAGLKYVVDWYFGWQGTYTASFLMIALSPLNGLGLIQLRIVMVLNVVLFGASLWVFINAVCRSLHVEERKYSILFFSLAVIGIFGFAGWTEVFYWFVGAMVYAVPMSFCLLGLAMALHVKSRIGICTSAVFMFLASGGALEIAGLGCFVLLGICGVRWLNRSVKRKDFIIFGIAVLGALINTVAPGNYVRHEVIDDTGLHFGTTMIYTVLEVLQTVEDVLFNTPCVLLILVAGMIGAIIGKTKKMLDKKVACAISFFCAVTPFVTCFPVFLGYSMLDEFPNRCKFIEMIVIICGFIFVAAIWGCIMSEKIYLLHKGETFIGIVLFLILVSAINPAWRASQSVSAQMWKEIAKGSYKEYYERVNEIYDLVENDSNENVFIYQMPEEAPHFPTLKLREDMSYWINTGCAGYFGKASVQTVSDPLYVQGDGQKNIRISRATFGDKTGYLSIYKVDEEGQVLEIIQELQLLDSNILISMSPEETGEMKLYFYEDPEGTVQIDEMEIEY